MGPTQIPPPLSFSSDDAGSQDLATAASIGFRAPGCRFLPVGSARAVADAAASCARLPLRFPFSSALATLRAPTYNAQPPEPGTTAVDAHCLAEKKVALRENLAG
ncbi:hypothetical protein OsJ_09740 [Oryza sativa Japonica Group]|uniref:Uncharacterized protein n=1 Tax=Oryza sativa subsp. japonica TaxID=39947 RepID=B9F5M7_ORYSJ|nr:hypothetical protein OsJ_09740 [Oryza sativa Japonica Group]